MVFVADEGSIFKAPLEKVLALGQSEGKHNHPSQINTQMSMEGDTPVLSFGTKMPDGQIHQQKIRITNLSPLGFLLEYIEGPMAGSKALNYYIPKGNETGVNVIGDFKSNTIPESQLKQAVLQGLEVAFNEDQENLKKL